VADLSGVLAKLDRAEEHRQAFDDLFEEFHAATRTRSCRSTTRSGLALAALERPPGAAAATTRAAFRDMISNLRTTLDYLVWQLVLAGGSRPGRRTGFPVVRKEKDWGVQSSAPFVAWRPEWAAEIEARQPFHLEQPAFHPLAILDHVNNLNKHRFLPVAVLSVEHLGLLINVEPSRARRSRRATFSTSRSPGWRARAVSRRVACAARRGREPGAARPSRVRRRSQLRLAPVRAGRVVVSETVAHFAVAFTRDRNLTGEHLFV